MLFLLSLARAEDIYVTSNAREAAILVNGVDTGYRTPATVPGVKPGETLISVEGACMRGEAVVNVAKGLTTRVSIVAVEQLGTLSLVPSPVAARLELDNAPYQGVPGVPLAVECGSHTVRASLDGYITAVVTVDVGMGQDLTVPLNLPRLGIGALDLSVTPRAATLLLDGRPVGSDAVSLPSVYQGVHVISAELDGYTAVKKQVIVDEGSDQAWHFELARTNQKKSSVVTRLGGGPESEAVEAQRETERAAERASAADRERVEAREREEAARVRAEAEVRETSAARREREAAEAAAHEAAEREAAELEAADVEAERDAAEAAERRAAAERKAVAAEREAAEVREAKAEREAAEAREAKAAREAKEAREARAEREREADAEAEAEREAEERRSAARKREDEPEEDADEPVASAPMSPGKVAKAVAGVSMLAGGVGASVFGVVAYDQTARAYTGYTAKIDGASTREDVRAADAYYDEYVVPRQTVLYGTAIGAGALLAGGVVVLLIDERLPTPVPTPGGGMLLWTGKF